MKFEKMNIEKIEESLNNIEKINNIFSKKIISESERFAEKYSIFLESYNGEFKSEVLKKEGFLGNGGAGTVFEVNDKICLKVMDNRPLADNYNNYDTEARVALDMNGFNIDGIRMPIFFSYYRTEHNREILMEKINGFNLQEVFNGDYYLPSEFVNKNSNNGKIDTGIIEDKLNNFFESMHDKNIYHGDIAARNIMISDEGDIVVIDTGRSGYLTDSEKEHNIQRDYNGIDDVIAEFDNYLENNIQNNNKTSPLIHFNNKENGIIENQIFDEKILAFAKEYILNNKDEIECDEFMNGLFLSKDKTKLILGIKAVIVNECVYYIGFKKD